MSIADQEGNEMEEDSILDCPTCGSSMLKIMINRPDTTITIDHCRTCEGYWFDGLELEKVVKEDIVVEEFDLGSSDVHEANFHCPRCSGVMETKVLFDVRVDRCIDCNGMWLDKGELMDIQERYRASLNDNTLLQLINDILLKTEAPA